jgi:UDPglucose 6-dehydrogenase
MKVSFANLLADVCEVTGADPESLLEGVGRDPRIGRKFMNPGVGYGGSCLPKDVSAFIHLAGEVGVDASVLAEVNRINKARPNKVLEFIKEELGDLSGAKIAIWGLAFKPNTDDVRNAPSIDVARLLLEAGASVRCHDPVAIDSFSKAIDKHPKLELVEDMYATIEGSNCLVLMTEWSQYREVDLSRVFSIMSNPFIIDGRQAIDQTAAERLGFSYRGLGRRAAQNNDQRAHGERWRPEKYEQPKL